MTVKKLIVIFSMFFMIQMEPSDREITYTIRDPKGKYPLPEKAPLLINGISSTLIEKKELQSRRRYKENLKASLTYNIVNLPKEIRVLIFEKLIPFDDTRKDDQKYCKARNSMRNIVENKPGSLGLFFKAFYAVEAQKCMPFDFGSVYTDLDVVDILDLDDNSAAKLHDVLHERLAPCCWGYSKCPSYLACCSSRYPKISATELEDLKMIVHQQRWEIRDGEDVDCQGWSLSYSAFIPMIAGTTSLLCACWAKNCGGCSCVSIKAAETTAFSLFGTSAGCLLIGVICCAGNSCGKDCKPLTSLRSITKKTK